MKKIILVMIFLSYLTVAFQMRQQRLSAFKIQDSKIIVRLAATAFCNNKCVDTWSCKISKDFKLTNTYYLEQGVTKAAGYVGYYPEKDQIVLAFRGSSNIQNWIENANFEQAPYPRCLGCQIHAGFYADYLSFSQIFKSKVAAILKDHPNAQILTTGHSLGAAISVICALEMKHNFPSNKIILHNYGQPRVGNKALAQHITKSLSGVYRVVHHKDLVPHLPPYPQLNYHHSPYQIFFDATMTSYRVCNDSGQDKSCSNQYFPVYNPNDHDFYFIAISQTKC